MARKKKDNVVDETVTWPKTVEGSHSRFVFNEDGSFDHIIDWDKLNQEINAAIANLETDSVSQPKRKRTRT